MKLTTNTVVEALTELVQPQFRAKCERNKRFAWLTHDGKPIVAAAYFAPPMNCLFEFDARDRFNVDRGRALRSYPSDAPLGFDFALYLRLCERSRARSSVRTRRQAAIDASLDLLPTKHGLNPTLRLAEAEVRAKLDGKLTPQRLREAVAALLEKRFSLHAGTTFLQLMEHPSGKPFVPGFGLAK